MTSIRTLTGGLLNLNTPRSSNIRIYDIAHALGRECRYSNQIRQFYSVAEHSVRVSYAVPPELALWGLLHDGSEAYMRDVPKPLKELLRNYKILEDKLQTKIFETFGLTGPVPPEIKIADHRLYAIECRELGRQTSKPVIELPYVPAARFLAADDARQQFLQRFSEIAA